MARLPRLALAGELHHVALCGHNANAVFADDADRMTFLGMLRECGVQHRVAIHAYVLLPREVQLLATPAQADGLAKLMQALGRRYVAAYNRRHGRSGTLWQGRYRNSVIEGGSMLMDATVYVESLPAVHGLVERAEDWPWSSAPHHLGRRRDPMVSEHEAYWLLGNTPFDRERAHAHMLDEGVPVGRARDIDAALRRGHALGSATFVGRLASLATRPVVAGTRGRPRKS